jgi:host factor-I protein
MEKSGTQNIQDAFLNSARREKTPVVINFIQGASLTGRIRSFDKFAVLLDSGGQDHLIFKHSISSILHERKQESS